MLQLLHITQNSAIALESELPLTTQSSNDYSFDLTILNRVRSLLSSIQPAHVSLAGTASLLTQFAVRCVSLLGKYQIQDPTAERVRPWPAQMADEIRLRTAGVLQNRQVLETAILVDPVGQCGHWAGVPGHGQRVSSML